MSKWTQVRCSNCSGNGMLCDYGSLGDDFYGAKECTDCNGSGFLSKSDKGVLAVYPGGPFRGREATS